MKSKLIKIAVIGVAWAEFILLPVLAGIIIGSDMALLIHDRMIWGVILLANTLLFVSFTKYLQRREG